MNSPELEKNLPEEEESTIFGASPIKKEAPLKKGKRGGMRNRIIAAVLVLLLLCGATFAVVKLAPKKETETSGGENIEVVSVEQKKIKSVKVIRRDSVSTYRSSLTEVKDEETGKLETEVSWTIEGIDESLTESVSISGIVDTACSLYATRTVEREEGADYGFEDPQYKIEVTGYNEKDSYTLIIGSETPSKSGAYATLGDEIYLISLESAADFATTDEQLATSFALSAAKVDADTLNYFSDDTLVSFDKITLSGKNFSSKLTFEMNKSDNANTYSSYLLTAPVRRYANTDNVAALFDIAANGLTAAEAYKYNPTAADLKEYGLKNPELELAVEFGGKKVGIKASSYDDEYFAVSVLGKENVIFKVANSFLPFAFLEETEFANNLTFIEILTEFESITFKADKTYKFEIDYTAETDTEDEILNISLDGKRVDTENFQRFYQSLVIECNELTFKKYGGTPALALEGVRVDGSRVNVKFIKHTELRYYVEVDSAPIGFISSANMDKILKYLPMAATDEKIPEQY